MIAINNLVAHLPDRIPEEITDLLLQGHGFHLERIVSMGHATPPGQWYDQYDHEWVVLLRGRAGLKFAGDPEIRIMNPGDWVNIPARCRHRVEWTDPDRPTVWLALHYRI